MTKVHCNACDRIIPPNEPFLRLTPHLMKSDGQLLSADADADYCGVCCKASPVLAELFADLLPYES